MWNYDSVPNAKISGPASAAYTTPRGLKLTYLAALRAMDFGAIGDMVECGVAAGSQLAMMDRAVGDHHSSGRRSLHAFDSFEGIPMAGVRDEEQPGIGRMTHDPGAPLRERLVSSGVSACSMDQVEANLRSWGITTPVHYHEGWFQDTLPRLSDFPPIALLRLDGDLYESTQCCLQHLYPRLAAGGIVLIDDWALKGCREAVMEYRIEIGLYKVPPIEDVGEGALIAWWQKK